MIIYLYGPDSYRRQKKVEYYVGEFRKKHSGLSLERFDLSENDSLIKFKDFVLARSLFSAVKMGLVKELPTDGAMATESVSILKRALNDPEVTVIISENKALPTERYSFLSKSHTVEGFELPTPLELTSFIKKEADSRGLKLSAAEINLLITSNGDTWGIVNDLDKLALGGRIEEGIENKNFWDLLKRLFNGDVAALTWLLETDDAAKIFNMAASLKQIDSRTLNKMADYDVAIKSGQLEYPEALLGLVIK